MKYHVVTTTNADDLTIMVQAKLDEGWDLHGGVSVSVSESDDCRTVIFAQAMIQFEDTEAEHPKRWDA